MSIKSIYLKATSASAAAKIFTVLSALVVIFLINDIAGKAGFGLAMLAFALNYIIASAMAALFQSITLYHVSRDPGHHSEKTGLCLTYGIILGFAAAYAEIILAGNIAGAMGKPEAALWFQGMAMMIPAFVANAILCGHERARQNVPRMVLFYEVLPAALKMIGLGALIVTMQPGDVLLAGWTESQIGWVYTISYALPFGILFLMNPITPRLKPGLLSLWDLRYGAQSMLSQFANKSLRHVVLLILGFFASASVVADFALAMRFANFLQLPKLAISQLQVPRMGGYLKDKNMAALLHEFDLMRMAALSATILGCAALVLFAPLIFTIFGEYEDAYIIFLLLAVASIIQAGFGTIGNYITIAGYAGTNLAINMATLGVVMAGLYIAVPAFDAMGAGLVVIIGALFSMSLMALAALQKDGLNTVSVPALLVMAGGAAMMMGAAFDALPDYQAAIGLMLFLLIGIIADRRLLAALYPSARN